LFTFIFDWNFVKNKYVYKTEKNIFTLHIFSVYNMEKTIDEIIDLAFAAMNKKLKEIVLFENMSEEMEFVISEEELALSFEKIAEPLALSFEKRIEPFLIKNKVKEETKRIPTLAEFKKMKIVKIKKIVNEYDIEVPKKGSGKSGNLVKKDYIIAISKYLEANGPYRFYGHREGKQGWMFSNFSPHPIEYLDMEWPTVEHAFQALKFYPHDMYWFNSINSAGTPQRAKQMGNTRRHKLRDDWEEVKIDLMKELITLKMETYGEIYDALMETGDREMIEASPTDYYWGEGKDRSGTNMLGKVLVQVRESLN